MGDLTRPPAPIGTATPPKPKDEDLDFFGMSHVGKVRSRNEDHFLYCTLHKAMKVGGTNLPNRELLELPSQRLASFGMVADGVGGRAGGDIASQAALEAIASYVTHTMQSFYTVDTGDEAAFLDSLEEAARLAHQAIIARAEADGTTGGMATTLSAIVAIWPHLYVLHVGDSRCYHFQDGVLTQLTRDQTMAQDLVDSGVLPADRASRSPFSSMLSSSLGGTITKPVVTRSTLTPGSIVLLCTDGLTKHVDDAQITTRLLSLTSSRETCEILVEDALADGGSDNVTVMVLRAR